MSVAWTIKLGDGAPKALQSWGIEGAVLTRRNLDVAELTFRIPPEDVFEDPAFEYGQTLSLWADGVQRFRGVVTRTPAFGNSKTEHDLYVVSGPWWQLNRLVYQQAQKV